MATNMHTPGQVMQSALILRIVLIVIMLSLCCSCKVKGDDANSNVVSSTDNIANSDADTKINSELKAQGENLRIDVENTFREMSKVNPPHETYDLKDLCKKYIPVGTSFSDLESILHAAGMRSKLQSVKFYSEAIHPEKGEFGVEIALSESMPRVAFFMIIRPDSPNSAYKKVAAITDCELTSYSL